MELAFLSSHSTLQRQRLAQSYFQLCSALYLDSCFVSPWLSCFATLVLTEFIRRSSTEKAAREQDLRLCRNHRVTATEMLLAWLGGRGRRRKERNLGDSERCNCLLFPVASFVGIKAKNKQHVNRVRAIKRLWDKGTLFPTPNSM